VAMKDVVYVRTPNDFSSRLTKTIRPWPFNFLEKKAS
jgi:hypothetical protein